MIEENYVVKINIALSNRPIFVKITDPAMSIDRIFTEAISTLKNQGKPLESQQLDQLYKAHQIFNEGKVMQKGDLFSELGKKEQTIANQKVIVAELDLVSSHSGGMGGSYADDLECGELKDLEVNLRSSIECITKCIDKFWKFSNGEGQFDNSTQDGVVIGKLYSAKMILESLIPKKKE